MVDAQKFARLQNARQDQEFNAKKDAFDAQKKEATELDAKNEKERQEFQRDRNSAARAAGLPEGRYVAGKWEDFPSAKPTKQQSVTQRRQDYIFDMGEVQKAQFAIQSAQILADPDAAQRLSMDNKQEYAARLEAAQMATDYEELLPQLLQNQTESRDAYFNARRGVEAPAGPYATGQTGAEAPATTGASAPPSPANEPFTPPTPLPPNAPPQEAPPVERPTSLNVQDMQRYATDLSALGVKQNERGQLTIPKPANMNPNYVPFTNNGRIVMIPKDKVQDVIQKTGKQPLQYEGEAQVFYSEKDIPADILEKAKIKVATMPRTGSGSRAGNSPHEQAVKKAKQFISEQFGLPPTSTNLPPGVSVKEYNALLQKQIPIFTKAWEQQAIVDEANKIAGLNVSSEEAKKEADKKSALEQKNKAKASALLSQ